MSVHHASTVCARSLHRLVIAGVTGTLAAAALLACPSTDRLTAGGSEPAVTDGGATPSGCALARPPPPPPIADVPGDATPLVLAVRKLTMTPGRPHGYDLDGYCTCDGGATFDDATACTPATPSAACDDPAGRDNAVLGLLTQFNQGETFYDGMNAGTGRGESTLLIEVHDFGRVADDPSIELRFFRSSGTWPTTPDGKSFLDDAGVLPNGEDAKTLAPKWDGTDVWATDPDSLSNGTPIARAAGYVHDWTIVAKAERILGITDPSIGGGIDLNDALFTGRLVDRGGRYEVVDGQVAGRVPVAQVNGIFRLRFERDGGARTCTVANPSFYPLFRSAICGARDVMENASDDGQGRACNALSYAVALDAVEARRGPLRPSGVFCPNAADECP